MVHKKIVIRPHQVNHFNRILEIIKHYYGPLDVSEPGTGKTHITAGIAQTCNLKTMVVCPKSSISTWTDTFGDYGLPLSYKMSYASLRGTVSNPPKHGLLKMTVIRENGRKPKAVYKTTALFESLVKEGMLLVFDEVQNLKNNNSQLASAHAMVKTIVRLGGEGYISRIMLLSGTPFDKDEGSVSILKLMGIITADKLYNRKAHSEYAQSKDKTTGLNQVFNLCQRLDPKTTELIRMRAINATTANSICHDLYTKIIKKHCSSSMPPLKIKKDAKDGYYNMPRAQVLELIDGVKMLSEAVGYRPDVGSTKCWGDISTPLSNIEQAKTPTVIRLAKEKLDTDPNCKVIIYLSYRKNMSTAYHSLLSHGAIYIDGDTCARKREELRLDFQADNNNCRVLVSNIQVSGVGIELDDQHGNHTRYTFIVPNYHFSNLHQAASRTCRAGSKSTAYIRFVWCKAFPAETSLLNSISRKGKTVRDTIYDEDHKITLPNEYSKEIEGLANGNGILDENGEEGTNKIYQPIPVNKVDKCIKAVNAPVPPNRPRVRKIEYLPSCF